LDNSSIKSSKIILDTIFEGGVTEALVMIDLLGIAPVMVLM